MEANALVEKLKANGTASDFYDLRSIREDYKIILNKIVSKDKTTLSLNIMCVICRNIEKIPKWKLSIDNKELLKLSLMCLSTFKMCNMEQRIKLLACHYHLHKYIITQKLPSELVFRFSHMPFKEECISDYVKTYWAIIVDRLSYIESCRKAEANTPMILGQLTSDLVKIIKLYNVGEFCRDIISVVVKKLFSLYGDGGSSQLSDCYIQLFGVLVCSELLVEDDVYYDIYKKISDCAIVLVENGLKTQKIDLSFIRRVLLKLFSRKSDIVEVVNIYYRDVLSYDNLSAVLKRLESSDSKVDLMSLPYYSNVLRLNLEHMALVDAQKWRELMSVDVQIVLMKIVIVLTKKLVRCEQLSTCKGCAVKNAAHDSLRLGFASKALLMASVKHGIDVRAFTNLSYEQIGLQNRIIKKLKEKKCPNIDKYLFKNQSNVHNLAILLYQWKFYEFSRKLFDFYLINEFQGDLDRKNLTRGLYNKAICEIDAKLYGEAITSAYFSLIFAYPDMLNTQKYISLVIDIKSRSQNNGVMSTNALKICAEYNDGYGCLKRMFSGLDFCKLLQYEFDMYSELWPSTQPIAGVISAYMDIYGKKYDFVIESEDVVLETLCRIILKSTDMLRNIHCESIKKIILELIYILNDKMDNKLYKMLYATLLLLKTEYDYQEASDQFQWKILDKNNKDPENIIINRTISQEFDVLDCCFKSIAIWVELSDCSKDPSLIDWLPLCLPVLELAVHLLLCMGQVGHALQMSYVIVKLSTYVDYMELYMKYAGVLFYHTKIHSDVVMDIFRNVSANVEKYFDVVDKDVLLLCLADAALYLATIGRRNLAVHLAGFVQEYIIYECENNNIIYDMPMSRLLEVFDVIFENDQVNKLCAASSIQKKWFAVTINKASWLSRRVRSLQIKYNCAKTTLRCADICRSVLLWRRARSSVVNALDIVGASDMAELYGNVTNAHKADDAQAKIENRLKYILYSTELKNTSETDLVNEKSNVENNSNKIEVLETMMRARNFTKDDKSPLSITAIPAFKMAEFLLHKYDCSCYLCSDPNSLIIALKIVILESSMYFRNKENEIANNYFEGALRMVDYVIAKLKHYCQNLKRKNYEQFLIQTIRDVYYKKIIELNIELLIEYSFFELSLNNSSKADDSIVRINELMNENNSMKLNCYLIDSYMNLVATSNKIKEKTRKSVNVTVLEQEFENLKLSPKSKELQKTPENKQKKPRNVENVKIKNVDEIPKLKLRVKKLNLDNNSPEKSEKTVSAVKKEDIEFKMPKTVKLQPEAMTPRQTRSKPKLVVTQVSQESDFSTPNKANAADFFTPIKNEETPICEDKFFTPLTSVKTYSNKNTLRQQVVKNLEKDFVIYTDPKEKRSGPKSNVKTESTKLKVESGTLKAIRDKRTLRRATSPGKLPNSEKSAASEKAAKTLVSSSDRSTGRPNLRSKK